MQSYYAKRAKEYESIYHRDDPTRQQELGIITKALQKACRKKNVLEIACGTGYWTERASHTAKHITATDAVAEVLAIAKAKSYDCPISFQLADAYNLPFTDVLFDAAVANLWFSHIPKAKVDDFLKGLHEILQKGSIIFMADNVFQKGVGGTLIEKPGDENTYKLRTLEDGTTHEVLKNYSTKQQLHDIFSQYDHNLSANGIFYGQCYWYVMYKI